MSREFARISVRGEAREIRGHLRRRATRARSVRIASTLPEESPRCVSRFPEFSESAHIPPPLENAVVIYLDLDGIGSASEFASSSSLVTRTKGYYFAFGVNVETVAT